MNSQPTFLFRETTAHDVTYIKRLNYLAEVFGDETVTPDTTQFRESNAFYTGAWDPADGVLAMDETLDAPAGGCWFIYGTDALHGTGFVAPEMPELAIAVENKYQGNGLGPQLIDRAADLARAKGCPGVSLCVHTENTRAHRLYGKLGFSTVGERDGGYVAMVRRFDGPDNR